MIAPSPQELAEAVREFLQNEILPILDDHRLKFRTLVAINGLGIAERELWATTPPREDDWELARRIRAGEVHRERGRAAEGAGGPEAARLEPPLPGEVRGVRRRLILMRHGDVSYVDKAGAPVKPEDVPLTSRGREQAAAARDALANVELDLVVASDLPRTLETAEIVAPGKHVELWPELAEWRGGRLDAIPPDELEGAFVGALQVKDEAQRFLGGESLGEALDRVHRLWSGCSPGSGTPHSPSSTAASTGSSSRTRSRATAPTSGRSSRPRRASTCSTSATTAGSSARSTTSPTTRSTPPGRRRWSTSGSSCSRSYRERA